MCRVSTVSVAASAMPTRNGGGRAAEINATEARWQKDMRAYRNLRGDGMQPPRIDGCARLEGAHDAMEVKMGHVIESAADRKKARDGVVRYEEMKAASAS